MAVRKLPNGKYTVEFESRGSRVFRRLPAGATKAQAEALDLRLRRELIDQEVLGNAPVVALDYAILEWAKVSGNGKAKLVAGAVKGVYLTRAGMVEATKRILAMQRVKEGTEGKFSTATLNRRLAVLKGTAKWAWKVQHWTLENLSPYVVMLDKKLERVRDRRISESQAVKLITQAPDFETQAYIALGCYALMRSGEIMKARPADILRGGLKLPQTKAGVPRVVPILRGLKPFLKALPLKTHVRTLYERFCETRDKLGLQGLVHHDLRRSGAIILLNRGIPLSVVAHILGDSLDVAEKHYAHVLDRTAAQAVRKGFKPISIPIRKRSTRNNAAST